MNTRILSVFRSDMDNKGRGYSHAQCKRKMEKPTAIFSQEGTKGMKTRDDRGAPFPLSVQVAQAQGRRRKKRKKKRKERTRILPALLLLLRRQRGRVLSCGERVAGVNEPWILSESESERGNTNEEREKNKSIKHRRLDIVLTPGRTWAVVASVIWGVNRGTKS